MPSVQKSTCNWDLYVNLLQGWKAKLTHCSIVTMTKQELRSQVFRCAAEGVCTSLVIHIELAQSEVTQGDVSGVINQDVFGFEITFAQSPSRQRCSSETPD